MNSRELLKILIGFDTISYKSNLALIVFVRDYLADLGVESHLIHDADRRKANLFATIGPTDRAGVILSGHTDVVPVEGQLWTVDPFVGTERDGRIYGRGSADMKGYLACVLAAVPNFKKAVLEWPVHLAFSYDEEVGCIGVRSLIEMLEGRQHQPAACIVGEPTELKPVLNHKGKLAVRCTVQGLACHSAHAPDGVNAVDYAAQIVIKLSEIRGRLAGPSRRDGRFDPAFSTVHTGVIQGGRALNIVPSECWFDWEVRPLPDLDPFDVESELKDYVYSELLPKMRAVSPKTDVSFETLEFYPGLDGDALNRSKDLFATLAARRDFGTVAYGTEGGLFHRAGIPTLVCGPGLITQAHKPDEFIDISQLEACDALMERLAERLAAPELL